MEQVLHISTVLSVTPTSDQNIAWIFIKQLHKLLVVARSILESSSIGRLSLPQYRTFKNGTIFKIDECIHDVLDVSVWW